MKSNSKNSKKSGGEKSGAGFTLIELLVVISIIGILAGMVINTSLKGAAQSRDSRRIQEVYQTAHALQLYYSVYHKYPDSSDTDDTGCNIHGVIWDAGNKLVNGPDDPFLQSLTEEEFLNTAPKEWRNITDPNGSQCIYRYRRMQNPCDGQCPGWYAILYAACETNHCPVGERPSCCDGSSWDEGAGANDPYDITIFLKE